MSQDNYDIWKDPQYDNIDYDAMLKQDYEDLGYNPREIEPVGNELPNEAK